MHIDIYVCLYLKNNIEISMPLYNSTHISITFESNIILCGDTLLILD